MAPTCAIVARMTKSRPEPSSDGSASELTDFGYRAVPKGEKAQLVREVFDSVAPRYDLMNDVMSMGMHRLWKRALVGWLRPRSATHLLDMAGGTGDVAKRFLAAGGGHVTILDINEAMLQQGRLRHHAYADRTTWLSGDAESLPLGDAVFDAVTIAFGIRNCTDIGAVLREARRVLKPGGRFLCLEFSRFVLPGLERIYDAYSFRLIPQLGAAIAHDRQAYEYLVESIRRFPDQHRFAEMIETAGLEQVSFRNLSGGIAAMHSAWRI